MSGDPPRLAARPHRLGRRRRPRHVLVGVVRGLVAVEHIVTPPRDLAITRALVATAADATDRAERAEGECRRLRADIARLVRERDAARRELIRGRYGVAAPRVRRSWRLP